MSLSPIARQQAASPIPVRGGGPPASLSPAPSPGGTLYSTTPGGTRVRYERNVLLELKNSPLSRTPPSNIPDSILRGSPAKVLLKEKNSGATKVVKKDANHDDEQFPMDM